MPWHEVSVMEQREEFVRLASLEGANRRELCRRFGVHPDTGYKWLRRHAAGEALADRSRRPHHSPNQTATALEAKLLEVRDAHPAWGARKLAACLARRDIAPPAASTVHAILVRNDRVIETAGQGAPLTRFERDAPNQLWQMDFKGWVRMGDGRPLLPLTIVDDHSRYLIGLKACTDQRDETVRGHLERVFRHHGMPEAIYVDNGSPWGGGAGERWTRFGVWLLKLGVRLPHARPYHPQGRGKNERFHRTLKREVMSLRCFHQPEEAQRAFDAWLAIYNHERPHEGIGMAVPADRYRPSTRPMPARPMEPEYDAGEITRKVGTTRAYIQFKGRSWPVGQAFFGERVAIRPRGRDGHYGIFFGAHQIGEIDLAMK